MASEMGSLLDMAGFSVTVIYLQVVLSFSTVSQRSWSYLKKKRGGGVGGPRSWLSLGVVSTPALPLYPAG